MSTPDTVPVVPLGDLNRDPRTPEEWQEAVDAADFFLTLHSARLYGLVTGGPKIDAGRCEAILAEGRVRGITPTPAEETGGEAAG